MGNRVEDLERQVAELQAAVNGLTEELVEMKERVRQLEDGQEVAVETGTQPAPGPVETEESASDDAATAEDGDGDGDGDDVLVPEQEASTPDAEAAKRAENGEETEDGESGDGDIIVA